MIAAKTPQGHREVAVRLPQSCRKGLYIVPTSLVIHYTTRASPKLCVSSLDVAILLLTVLQQLDYLAVGPVSVSVVTSKFPVEAFVVELMPSRQKYTD